MNFFLYKITYYCGCENKSKEEKGIVCGKTCSEAVERLTSYYGEQETEKFSIEFLTEDGIVDANDILRALELQEVT